MITDTQSDPAYGYTAHLHGVTFEDARARVAQALKQEGFGILTEIDVQATLKATLGYNLHLAHQALETDLGVGLLLPCNVCVWEEEGGSVVSMARPQAMFEVVQNEALQPIVDDAEQRLRRALDTARRAA